MNVDVEFIAQLQRDTDRIRNVCVLAHVDHGKTTLSDHLIAANGLIHPRLAGELRYMDSNAEEQERGITMKSSSITLLHVPGAALLPEGPNSVSRDERLASGFLVNLIDSPGHVDFCSEVSTAARLSDGALVVVDAVEGVCIQTHAVLRQAWEEKVAMCLVINKIDRLVLELKLSPEEAYERLAAIVAHVNMIVSLFRSEKFISEADSVLVYEDAKAAQGSAATDAGGGSCGAADEQEDASAEDEDLFSPAKGNVAFVSAHDGWGFRVGQFAEMYAAKLGCNAASLEKTLWGDFALQPKTRRIVKIKNEQRGRLKPLFVSLALEPLWKAYTACEPEQDHAAVLGKMVQGLGLTGVTEKAINHSDARVALRNVLRSWLPLAEAVLGMVSDRLPSPSAAAPVRVSRLLPPRAEALKGALLSLELTAELDAMEAGVGTCDASDAAPTVVYVSKMVAVPANALPRSVGEPSPADPHEERFLAFGRVFSGVVKAGQAVHVLPATYNPADPASEHQTAVISSLYLMMGRGLERLPEVPAGNVLALAGLDRAILKSATVASSLAHRPLAPLLFQVAPIVKVAVEATRPGDMPALVEGLRLLHRADPLVQVSMQESGEHVVAAAGEVHLDSCIKELRERFAKVELHVSPPLVAFRETVAAPDESVVESSGGGVSRASAASAVVVEATTPSGACTLRVRAMPLPESVASVMDQHAEALKTAFAGTGSTAAEGPTGAGGIIGDLETLGERLRAACAEENTASSGGMAAAAREALPDIWMLGPKRSGANFLLVPPSCKTASLRPSLWDFPPHQVIKLSKHHQKTPGVPSAHAAEEESANGAEDSSSRRHVTLELGNPAVSLRLGLVSEEEKLSPAQQQRQQALPEGEEAATATYLHAAEARVEVLATRLADLGLLAAARLEEEEKQKERASFLQYLQYSVQSGVASGFGLATAAGPLCDEPMWAVAFQIEARLNCIVPAAGEEDLSTVIPLLEDVYGPLSGQVTSTARQAVRQAVMEAGPRLVEAAFLCEVTTSSEGLSAVYAVLGRRRARILREEMREGSDLFTVHAYMPAEASFGFADELRRKSSGAAAASLMLSHWERLGVDPFFVPVTEEEREEFGESGQGVGAPNLARKLIDSVRRRKGLAVEQKVVESATRQRTRARKV